MIWWCWLGTIKPKHALKTKVSVTYKNDNDISNLDNKFHTSGQISCKFRILNNTCLYIIIVYGNIQKDTKILSQISNFTARTLQHFKK